MDKLELLVDSVLVNQADTFKQFEHDYEALNQIIIKGARELRKRVIDIIRSHINEGIIKEKYLDIYIEFISNLNNRKVTKKPEVNYEKKIQSDLITFESFHMPWQTYQDKEQAKEMLEPEQILSMDQACGASKIYIILEKIVINYYREVIGLSIWMKENKKESIFKDVQSAKKAAVVVKGIEKLEYFRFKIMSQTFKTYRSRATELTDIQKRAEQNNNSRIIATHELFKVLSKLSQNYKKHVIIFLLSSQNKFLSSKELLSNQLLKSTNLLNILDNKSQVLLSSSFIKLLRYSYHKDYLINKNYFYTEGHQACKNEVRMEFLTLIPLILVLVWYILTYECDRE